jgi:hypothetical protein
VSANSPAPAGTYGTLGELVTNVDVDEIVIGLLKTWMPFHVRWLETERGLEQGFLAEPQVYSSVLEDEEFPDRLIPAVYVTSAETLGNPTMDLTHDWSATWRVRVSCVTRGINGVHTRRLASYLEGMTRRIMLAPQDTFNGEIRWRSTNVAPVYDRSGQGRYLAAGIGDYEVHMDHVVHSTIGPTPPASIYPPPSDPLDPIEPLVPINDVTIDVRATVDDPST